MKNAMQYCSAPASWKFVPTDLAELEAIEREILEAAERPSQTEWGDTASSTDVQGVALAIQAVTRGQKVFVAVDGDGYYFAVGP